ncbi:branched-chain amino acid ABC transporter permease [Oscillibacter sp. MSJ-2]|uniref:Branched-chain amino acid ABC transporter permease n=1 Tax=Dysosmobacter acutus TaxID=2841504 RepID=A0ABS6F9V2_9FIRM|nr:branched-chain amino acid ABC transporter permease [Dysosmobacter acutus]MBU5626840.1 branched-chain amino acid ABC transporter permease [Dysosmobacter acutus]
MKKLKTGSRVFRRNLITYALVIVAYVVLQILNGAGAVGYSLQGMLVPICAYVVMAISLNLTVGVLGELSLGHAGFMSVGAFTGVTAAVALQDLIPLAPLRLAIAMAVGAAFAALAGFLIGIPVLRLNGDYLAIVTLAFGEIIKSIFNNLYVGLDSSGFHMSLLSDKTHLSEGGKLIIGGPMGVGGIQTISTFTAGFLLILITLAVVFNLVNSRSGRAIMAIRDNRIAAESIGLNITRYKMMAFVTSAALAGAAGTLFAMNYSTIVANKFDFNTSILILVFVVLGGLGNMLGSIIAAAALTILPEALRQFSDYRMLVYAIVLILVMLATNSPQVRQFIVKIRVAIAGKGKGAAEDV